MRAVQPLRRLFLIVGALNNMPIVQRLLHCALEPVAADVMYMIWELRYTLIHAGDTCLGERVAILGSLNDCRDDCIDIHGIRQHERSAYVCLILEQSVWFTQIAADVALTGIVCLDHTTPDDEVG